MFRPAWLAAPCLLALAACAARTPGTSTPARTEIVVDEALVVRASPGSTGRDQHGLPPLPQPLETTSEDFRAGHALALPLLSAPGPAALVGTDLAAYEAWTHGPFTQWMMQRGEQTRAAVERLAAVQHGPASEHVTAAAIVGLIYTRLTEQLVAIPPPPHLSGDAMLTRHYRKGLDDVSLEWRKAAQGAFFHCAKQAALQTDAAFGLWLELCHERLAALGVERERAEQRAATLAAESAAVRLKAAGVPPAGPEICWKPHVAARPEPDGGVLAAAGDDRSSAGKRCALPSLDEAALAAPTPVTARDALYGVRDAGSGVRLSLATEVLPSMDLRPLATAAHQAALAACFAKHVEQDEAITVAVHTSLSVDERGHVKSALVSPEPSDQARPPGAALTRCLEQALKKIAFDCSVSGQGTQGKALLCLRRD